jgi:signal transduction histidine kinase
MLNNFVTSNRLLRHILILLVVISGIFFSSNISVFGESPIFLEDNNTIHLLDSSYFKLWNPQTNQTYPAVSKFIFNNEVNKDVWITFEISNTENEIIEWYLVSYNYAINEIDLVAIDQSGKKQANIFRDTLTIHERYLQYKQPVFRISLKPKEKKRYYLRVKNDSSYNYVFALYSHESFLIYFIKENLIYGIFYGFMLFVFLYNLFHYLLLREKVILFYCFFIFFQLIHMLFRDGTGLFLIDGFSQYADSIKNFSRGGFNIFLLLYTYYFFRSDKNTTYYKWFIGIIIIRGVYTIFMLNDSSYMSYHFELFIILLCAFFALSYYKKDNSDARYMIVGILLLSISYLLSYLSIVHISALADIGFFAMYYGIAGESIFMTLALTERFKRIKLDNFKKQQMNTELESLVAMRTAQIADQNKLLEEKSTELNLFLYSASHDLRGPLKTILGLCNIGIGEKNANHEELYRLIIRKLNNLESNISDLSSVTKLKNENLPKTSIDFLKLHEDMKERFQNFRGFETFQFNYSNTLRKPFIADLFSIKCIYQNIFENALKYKDTSRDFTLSISISEEEPDIVTLCFEDNGVGISEKILPNIFNMFYRGNEKSKDDTGLGLYIVKQAILKLHGTIDVKSEEGKGTVFWVKLPYNQSLN